MKILITGAGGFLGQPLCRALLDQGHEVVGLGRGEAPLSLRGVAGFKWLKIDLGKELLNPENLSNVDILFHLAAVLTVSSPYPESEFFENNERATLNLLQVAAGRVNKFIFASTQMVYGDPNSLEVDESYPLAGSTAYGISKINAENWVRWFHLKQGGHFTILRFTGFVESKDSVFNYFLSQAKAGHKIEVLSEGKICRDYLSLKDALQVFLACVSLPADTENRCLRIYNIGSGNRLNTEALAHLICSAVGSNSQVIPVSQPAPRSNFIYNISRAKKELGFSPSSLAENVKALVDLQRS